MRGVGKAVRLKGCEAVRSESDSGTHSLTVSQPFSLSHGGISRKDANFLSLKVKGRGKRPGPFFLTGCEENLVFLRIWLDSENYKSSMVCG